MKNMNNVVMNMLFFDILIFLFCKSPWINCINEYFSEMVYLCRKLVKVFIIFFIINKPIMKFDKKIVTNLVFCNLMNKGFLTL